MQGGANDISGKCETMQAREGVSRRDVVDQLYAPRLTNQNAKMLLLPVIMLGKRAEHSELGSLLNLRQVLKDVHFRAHRKSS